MITRVIDARLKQGVVLRGRCRRRVGRGRDGAGAAQGRSEGGRRGRQSSFTARPDPHSCPWPHLAPVGPNLDASGSCPGPHLASPGSHLGRAHSGAHLASCPRHRAHLAPGRAHLGQRSCPHPVPELASCSAQLGRPHEGPVVAPSGSQLDWACGQPVVGQHRASRSWRDVVDTPLGWLDVLVETEHVRRVVFGLDLDQPVVVAAAIGRAQKRLALFALAGEVEVGARSPRPAPGCGFLRYANVRFWL